MELKISLTHNFISVFCDKGFYFYQNNCMACAIGYFKTNRGNIENCTKCDDGYLTSNMASTAVTDCNQRKTLYFQEYLEGFFSVFVRGWGE